MYKNWIGYKIKSLILIILLSCFPTSLFPHCYEWAIIGAGPAGITALAVLLELKTKQTNIVWIDPEFNLGRMGKYYRNVSGNLPNWRLVTYFDGCPILKEFPCTLRDSIYTYPSEEFLPLRVIVDPLLEATRYLQTKVPSIKDFITDLNYSNDIWILLGNNEPIIAKKVILATGSHPKKLDYPLPEIPLDLALDKDILTNLISPNDCIAVFGSMHSAFLVLKYLSELPVKQVINFYSSPYFYGKPGTAGLEGITAWWAKNILEKKPPPNLIRLKNTQENRDRYLQTCTKVIYAIGYERNSLLINGNSNLHFDSETGIIDRHLYGIGIAFPIFQTFADGKKVDLNGFNTYLEYAKELIPEWIKQ